MSEAITSAERRVGELVKRSCRGNPGRNLGVGEEAKMGATAKELADDRCRSVS